MLVNRLYKMYEGNNQKYSILYIFNKKFEHKLSLHLILSSYITAVVFEKCENNSRNKKTSDYL